MQLEEDTDRDRYMSPLEAKSYGLIDHVIGGDDAGFKFTVRCCMPICLSMLQQFRSVCSVLLQCGHQPLLISFVYRAAQRIFLRLRRTT